jgi:hypothetical protein
MLATLVRRARALVRLGILELRRSTGGKAIYLAVGCVVWFIIIALWNALAADVPMEGTGVQNSVLTLPLVLLVVFLGSQVVASDQDNRSLEVVLALPWGRVAIWLTRLAVAVLFAWAIGGLLALLSWVFIAGFSVAGVWAATFFPLLFFACLAFALSILFRSGTVAALVSSLVLIGIFLTTPAWQGGPLFYIYPFLNPYLPPPEALPAEWVRSVTANRMGVAIFSAVLLLFAMAGMRRRERLL